MKYLFFGAGSIGGFLAIRLATADKKNNEVSLIVRGKHLEVITNNGFTLLGNGGEKSIKDVTAAPEDFKHITSDISNINEIQDVIFLAVKAHQLKDFVSKNLKNVVGPETLIVTLQNGIPFWYFYNHKTMPDLTINAVDPQGLLYKNVPLQNIVGCVVYPACRMKAPGVIQHIENIRFPIGDIALGAVREGDFCCKEKKIQQLSQALIKAEFKSPVLDDIRSEIWLKMWGSLAFNPISALTHASLETIGTFGATRKLVEKMMLEAQKVAEALGAHFRVNLQKRLQGAINIGDHKTSTCQDVENGRSMEIEPILGALCELACTTGLEVPHCTSVYLCTKLLNHVTETQKVKIVPIAI